MKNKLILFLLYHPAETIILAKHLANDKHAHPRQFALTFHHHLHQVLNELNLLLWHNHRDNRLIR